MTGPRQLGAPDQAAWRKLRLSALKAYPEAFLTTYEEASARSAAAEREMLEAGTFTGLFEGIDLVAMGALMPQRHAAAAHRGEIGAFCVAQAQQGSGVADRVMEALAIRARHLKIWQLELFVAETNPRARRFYERHGFEAVGRLPNAVKICDVYNTDILMVRDLRR